MAPTPADWGLKASDSESRFPARRLAVPGPLPAPPHGSGSDSDSDFPSFAVAMSHCWRLSFSPTQKQHKGEAGLIRAVGW